MIRKPLYFRVSKAENSLVDYRSYKTDPSFEFLEHHIYGVIMLKIAIKKRTFM